MSNLAWILSYKLILINLVLLTSIFISYIPVFEKKSKSIIKDIKTYTENNFMTAVSINHNYIPTYQKIINDAGYLFEEHKIRTEDGYILTAWRIPMKLRNDNQSNKRSYKSSDNSSKTNENESVSDGLSQDSSDPGNSESTQYNKKPIILQHGLIDSSYTWLLLDKNHSLPFLLVDQGYDVWLTNTRGNAISFEHEIENDNYDSSSPFSKYWDFSFHEMAIYDLPAIVNYIKLKSNSQKVDYICHSQGGLIYFILYTLRPDFVQENFAHFISLGTVITTFTSKSKLIKLGSSYKMSEIVDNLHIKNILCFNKMFYDVLSTFCKTFNKPCYSVVNFIVGDNFDTKRINSTKLFKDFIYVPAGTSIKNIRHWMQMYNSKKLAQYDYGEEINLNKYGNKEPPEYELNKFVNYKVRSVLYTSDKDPFSNLQDLSHLTKYLNKDYVEVRSMHNYNHLDYLWSDDAKKDIYLKIIQDLKK